MSQMLKSSGAMGAATMTSRVLGLVREQVYAAFMGTSWQASAFYTAFVVPNLFRRLLGEGVLTATFIPIFKDKEKNEGEVSMWRAANAVISGLFVFTLAIVILVMTGISVALTWFHLAPETRLMLQLLQTMFPYMLLVCLAATCMGMLNARGHFFVPALGPALLNIAMISSVLFLAPKMGTTLEEQMFGLALGVLVAGLAQALFQMPALFKEGYRYQWVSPWSDPTVREVVKRMVPGAVGVAAFQINVVVTYGLGFLGENKEIIADFNYAVRLMELPQGVFGVSLATFLLPALSGLAAEKKYDEFRGTLKQGASYLIFLNLLAAVFLFVLAEPIIRLLFERGKFTPASTINVSYALACLAPGLIGFSLVNILARAFYALNDVKTPMRISVFCLALNLILAVVFLVVLKLGASGLAIANTMSSICNLVLLIHALRRKLKTLDLGGMQSQLWRIALMALAAGVIAWGVSVGWDHQFGHRSLVMRLGHVFVPMTVATAFYLAVTTWMKIPSALDVIALVRQKLLRR